MKTNLFLVKNIIFEIKTNFKNIADLIAREDAKATYRIDHTKGLVF